MENCVFTLGYASDSGAGKICRQGTKAMERSDRAGEGVGGLSCTLNIIIRG